MYLSVMLSHVRELVDLLHKKVKFSACLIN
jgi:hypothetical protein